MLQEILSSLSVHFDLERLVYLVKQLLLELLVLNQLPDARQAFGDLIRWQSAH